MDLTNLSIKTLGELEQQLTQLLKTMRNVKLNEHEIYQHLQALEQEISEARREQFDNNNGRYDGY